MKNSSQSTNDHFCKASEDPERSGASRRAFLKSIAAIGAGAFLPVGGVIAQVAPSTSSSGGSSPAAPKGGRIDIHGHMTPPIVIETVGAEALGGFAKWTPEIALAEMEKYGITTAMVSVPPH